jgi:hypothetical protein
MIKNINDRIEYRNESNQIHREDGPAVVYDDGSEYWYLNNLQHREDGPASKWDGNLAWYKNGKLHRIDGPAVILNTGVTKYHIEGYEMDHTEFISYTRSIKLKNILKS